MPRQKHKPQRTCIGCREVKNKRDLVRVVRTPDGDIIIDQSGKANGRGVYMCPKADCLQKGLQKNRLAHALKTTLTEEKVAELQQFMHHAVPEF